jgi:hypothetical protein
MSKAQFSDIQPIIQPPRDGRLDYNPLGKVANLDILSGADGMAHPLPL